MIGVVDEIVETDIGEMKIEAETVGGETEVGVEAEAEIVIGEATEVEAEVEVEIKNGVEEMEEEKMSSISWQK